MENEKEYPGKEKITNADGAQEGIQEGDTTFENPSVDPGFETVQEESDDSKGKPENDNAEDNDALNYNNDREKGAYNPKNI